MRYLTPEHWQRFVTTSGRDGRYFEDLVAKLLVKSEGGLWTRTPHSWDRGRDFFRADRQTIAAEAKNHDLPLSIRSLSPSLVMAVADNLQEILFFSYSRINANALEHLAAFQEHTKVKIRAFHDDSLEDVILRYPTILREFFPTYDITKYSRRGTIEITTRMSRDPEIQTVDSGVSDTLFEDETSPTEIGFINLLETFALDFYVYNKTRRALSLCIRFLAESISQHFELLDKEIEENTLCFALSLSPGEVTRRRVHFRPFAPGARIPLPRWTIEPASRPTKRRMLPERVTVTAIPRSPLVGSDYLSAINSFTLDIAFRDKPVFRVIYGRSGTGKTRILYELRNLLFKHGYRLIHIRGELAQLAGFDEFIRRYLSIRYGLPRQAPDEVDRTLDAPWRDDPTSRRVVDRLLYDADWAPSMRLTETQDAFLGSLVGHKIAIVIDDVQGLDQTTLRFLSNLTTVLMESNHRLAMILSFNTDLIRQTSFAALYLRRLVDLSATAQSQVACTYFDGFSASEAREFLNNCLRPREPTADVSFTAVYQGLTASLMQRVDLTPLFLEQILLHLEQRQCIKRDIGGYYVYDYIRLKSEIDNLETGGKGQRLDALLARRYESFESSLNEEQWIILELLSELIRIPRAALSPLRMNLNDVRFLIELGVIDDLAARALEFRHQTLFRLIKSRRTLSDRTKSLLDALLNDERWREIYFPQAILRAIDLHNLTPTLGLQLLDKLHAGQIDTDYFVPLANAILLELASFLTWSGPDSVIRTLDDMAYRLRPFLGYEGARQMCAAAHDKLLGHRSDLKGAGLSFIMFSVRYGSILLGLRQDNRALKHLQNALQLIDYFSFHQDRDRQEAVGLVANRICAALLGHRKRLLALEMGERASRAAQVGGFRYIEFQQHIDNGYVYYGFRPDSAALLQEWRAAIDMFDPSFLPHHELITNRAVAKLHEGHVAILEGRITFAVALLEEERWVCKEALDPFHESKMILLTVVASLMDVKGARSTEDLLDLVAYVKDTASRFDLGQVYWIAFHTGAKVYQMAGDALRAVGEFDRALKEIHAVTVNAEMEDRFDWFFEDYAISMRDFNADIDAKRLALVKRSSRRKMVRQVMSMSSTEFRAFKRCYQPKTTYFRDHFNLPCP